MIDLTPIFSNLHKETETHKHHFKTLEINLQNAISADKVNKTTLLYPGKQNLE